MNNTLPPNLPTVVSDGLISAPDGIPVSDNEIAQFDSQLQVFGPLLRQLPPVPNVTLTAEEAGLFNRERAARLILDSAAHAAMECSDVCPFLNRCELAKIGKQPAGQPCPQECQYILARFIGWMVELGRTLATLLESERTAISQLVGLQVELMRVRAMLAQPENVSLQQRAVRKVNPKTGRPAAWEDQVHVAAEREDQIIHQIRMIMHDLELTPEMKTRRKKALQIPDGEDLATRQSNLYDRFRAFQRSAGYKSIYPPRRETEEGAGAAE